MVNIIKSGQIKFSIWMSLCVLSIISMVVTASLLEILYKTAESYIIVIIGISCLFSMLGFIASLIKALEVK